MKTTSAADEIWTSIWQQLQLAVVQRRHAWHTGVIATCDSSGAPALRTVVLRSVDVAAKQLRCHSDIRSSKCREVRARPDTSWLFYSPAERIQIRLGCQSVVHHEDDIARQAWEATRVSSRRCYLSRLAPGEEMAAHTAHLPEDLVEHNPDLARSEEGWPHFAVLVSRVFRVDWVHLNASGHERMVFACDPTGHWQPQIVAP